MQAEKDHYTKGVTRRHLGWFLFYRVLLVSLFLGGTIVYLLRGVHGASHPSLPFLYVLFTFYFFQALVFNALLLKSKRVRFCIQLQVVCDLLFSSALIYFTGGLESHFSFLFLLVILGSSLLLSRRETLVVASAAAILYGSLLDLQFYGYLPRIPGAVFPESVDGREVFYNVFVNVVAFFLVGILGGFFSDRLKRSEQALERREIDFEELEKLNRTILAHIGSGLMIINAAGRIRAFNRAAENISGLSLMEVYNRPLQEVFHDFDLYNGDFREVERGEGSYLHKDGDVRVLGFSSTLMGTHSEEDASLLVSFQDLTHLRDVEQRLQQADKLAAIGKMASGMAHEIRNPLASISGSLQLLLEGGQVSSDGERLARIVVREADRLSQLITSFLAFARPSPPQRSDVDLVSLCRDIATMASTDPRFDSVEIECESPESAGFHLDREQFKQVLWNLVINAAEAMDGVGRIVISVDEESSIIVVEDNGPGVSGEDLSRIFDPFYSTKEMGTGLGLAMVYGAIEAHGGHVAVKKSRLGGAAFELSVKGGEVVKSISEGIVQS